jgi:predicted transcriptional regulator of viral defense system
MKHKSISGLSSKILATLSENGKDWFALSELYSMFPDLTNNALCVQVKRMADKGLLMRVREGIYYIIPFEQESLSFMPNWHLLAPALAGENHYIGYYSALQIHGLITQPALKEQIVVDRQIKPSEIEIKGVRFQFICHNDRHYFGDKKIWIDSYNRVLVSDLEKTIVDCLYRPSYAGGITEIAKAIFMSRDRLSYQILADYVERFGSQAVLKRLGYLLDLLEIDAPITKALHEQRSSSVSLLDTEAPKQGKTMSYWNIVQNVDADTIREGVFT